MIVLFTFAVTSAQREAQGSERSYSVKGFVITFRLKLVCFSLSPEEKAYSYEFRKTFHDVAHWLERRGLNVGRIAKG